MKQHPSSNPSAIGRAAPRVLVLAALAAGVGAPAPASAQGARQVQTNAINIPFEHYELPNGLQVILSEDHATPTVAVNVMYHVGSKNEQVGHTGFAHLFEHTMFTGSGHVPYGLIDKLTEGVGGENNASTWNDFTTYFETIPSNYLEDALWFEADRMGWLLDALDSTKYNAQRDIVKNERRQSVDNRPYGRVDEVVAAAIYPAGHPYSWPVIGSMADLTAATLEDVKNFFRLYYAPNNATLSIVGDFDPGQAKAWVAKYFGNVPRGNAITRPRAEPVRLAAEKRLTLEDRVQVPRLYITWPTVGERAADQYALDVLSDILAGPRTARLTKALVYDRQSAAAVDASQDSKEGVGEFTISITPRPGHTLGELEQAADSVLDRFRSEGPTAEELQRAKAGLELDFVRGLESNLGKSFRLVRGQTIDGNPGQYAVDYRRYRAVSQADVQRVAQTYLGRGRVVLSDVPQGGKDQASNPERSVLVSQSEAR